MSEGQGLFYFYFFYALHGKGKGSRAGCAAVGPLREVPCIHDMSRVSYEPGDSACPGKTRLPKALLVLK